MDWIWQVKAKRSVVEGVTTQDRECRLEMARWSLQPMYNGNFEALKDHIILGNGQSGCSRLEVSPRTDA